LGSSTGFLGNAAGGAAGRAGASAATPRSGLELAPVARVMRQGGTSYNYRMETPQVAILRVKLRHLFYAVRVVRRDAVRQVPGLPGHPRLPLFHEMTEADQDTVVEALRAACAAPAP
jgi:hypothetical protein